MPESPDNLVLNTTLAFIRGDVATARTMMGQAPGTSRRDASVIAAKIFEALDESRCAFAAEQIVKAMHQTLLLTSPQGIDEDGFFSGVAAVEYILNLLAIQLKAHGHPYLPAGKKE